MCGHCFLSHFSDGETEAKEGPVPGNLAVRDPDPGRSGPQKASVELSRTKAQQEHQDTGEGAPRLVFLYRQGGVFQVTFQESESYTPFAWGPWPHALDGPTCSLAGLRV